MIILWIGSPWVPQETAHLAATPILPETGLSSGQLHAGASFLCLIPPTNDGDGKEVGRNMWTRVGGGLQPPTWSSVSLASHRLCWNLPATRWEGPKHILERINLTMHTWSVFFCLFFSHLSSSHNFSLLFFFSLFGISGSTPHLSLSHATILLCLWSLLLSHLFTCSLPATGLPHGFCSG